MKHLLLIPIVAGIISCSETSNVPDTDTPPSDPAGTADTADTADAADTADTLRCPEDIELGLETTTGCIIGDNEGNIEQWIGIPYAQPPIGERRFARTVPVLPWNEPLEADEFGPMCMQWDLTGFTPQLVGDEDCLTLNIFRPENADPDVALPILFFTHGGSYTQGAGSLDTYALEPQLAESAIVITHNYRLGPFGFFAHAEVTAEDADNHDDGGSSGNQGLFDSLTALQWVVDNAEVMGGDANQVLVFGESAGGTTTCAFLNSPLAEGMFQAALIQSVGCGFIEWPLNDLTDSAYTISAEDYGAYIAWQVGCDGLQCLRDMDANTFMTPLIENTFGANVDGVFVPRPARQAFAEGDFNQVPVFAGFNANEGVFFTFEMGIETNDDLQNTLLEWGEFYALSDPAALLTTYTSETFGSPQQAFDAFYGDLTFSCPTRSFLEAISPHVDARAYYFTESPDWLAFYPDIANWGAFHGAELPFVFGTNMEYYSASEQTLSNAMQDAWIRTLNQPAIDPVGDWPIFGASGGVAVNGGTFVQLDSGGVQIQEGVFNDRCDLLDAQGWHNY